MRSLALAFVAVLGSTVMFGACARGTQFEGAAGYGDAGGGGEDGDGDAGGTSGEGGAGASTTGEGGAGGSTTTTTTTSSTSGSGGTGGEGGMGGGGSGGGSVCSFASPNTCASAEQLPAVSGDEGGTSTASGTGSKWFKVKVEETSSSIFESDLSYQVTLTSPAGMDYDLYVRQGPQDGSPNCSAPEKKGTLSGGAETVSASWDDDQGLGGEDDSLWLSIEVRYVSGDNCNAKWSLTVTGDP